jgi:hypothetical protein
MADLDNIDIMSISDMNTDEALELLRQIRLNRRVSVKPQSTPRTTKNVPKVSEDQAAEILKLLTGEK